MLSREAGVSVEVLREAARERVTSSSLRIIAGEIGMSWKGLELFIAGTRPHPATVRKLTEWYVKQGARSESETSPELARAALAVLVRHFPADRREDAVRRIEHALGEVGVVEGVPAPTWLARDS